MKCTDITITKVMIIGTYMAVFLYSRHKENEIIPDTNLLIMNLILFVLFSVDKH